MTAYEQGFLSKCAEYGIDGRAMLVDKSGYEDGFLSKCAEYGIDGRQALEGMRKQALSPLTRLAVKLHPRINDPSKLSAFQRFFTTSKPVPEKIIKSTGLKIPTGGGLPYGVGGSADGLSSIAIGAREDVRLSPEKILAALGLAGAAGTGAYKGLSGKGTATPVAPAAPGGINKKLLMKLLAGTAAVGAGGAIASKAVGKSKKDDEDDEKKKKKSGNR